MEQMPAGTVQVAAAVESVQFRTSGSADAV
jgi:hypothetical protein